MIPMRHSLITLASLLVLASCNAADNAPSKSANAPTNSTGVAAVFPETIPAYVPRYAGATKAKQPGGGIANMMFKQMGGGAVASFETPDAPEKVLAFYKAELLKNGLEEAPAEANTEPNTLAFFKSGAGGGVVMVIATKNGDLGSIAQVMYLPDDATTK